MDEYSDEEERRLWVLHKKAEAAENRKWKAAHEATQITQQAFRAWQNFCRARSAHHKQTIDACSQFMAECEAADAQGKV